MLRARYVEVGVSCLLRGNCGLLTGKIDLIQVYEEAFQGFNVALALLDGSSAQHEAVLADVEELWESYAHDTRDTWHT